MLSSTTLVCIVDLMCIVGYMCLLACNVCGRITAVALSCCDILHFTLFGSTSGPAWYPSCPVISGKLPSSGLLHYLWFISVCVGHLSAAFSSRTKHISLRFFYIRELVKENKITMYYISTENQLADVGTKHLNKHRLQQLLHIKNF